MRSGDRLPHFANFPQMKPLFDAKWSLSATGDEARSVNIPNQRFPRFGPIRNHGLGRLGIFELSYCEVAMEMPVSTLFQI
jgi:hypothetical protein